MRERMIVTDVARMLSGACIAGYSTDLSTPIRPVVPFGGGLEWEQISVYYNTILPPFSVINVDLDEPRPDPPHCEDVVLREPPGIEYVGMVPAAKIPTMLERIAFHSIDDAFDGLVRERRHMSPGKGARSLATVRVSQIESLGMDMKREDHSLRLRLAFRDGAGVRYRLPVTDVALLEYCQIRMTEMRQSPGGIRSRIRGLLNNAEHIYVRVGASRPFKPSDDSEDACYLLVTGVHAIPAYRRLSWRELFPDSVPRNGAPLPEDVVAKLNPGRYSTQASPADSGRA